MKKIKAVTTAKENQNIEWKTSWRDDYLKWICGFANAQGGRLYIGRDDNGVLVGLADAKRLLEELPNKIRTTMGIIANVNLCSENGIEYIVIEVPSYSNAINYRGKYYLRSGSTNQELTGFALDELILRKYGRTWDAAPVPRANINDFYNDAFDIFRKKAVLSGRLTEEDVAISNEQILKFLKLTEGDYLLKSALLLFHQDPESWCFGSCVKIGYFENDADLLYQDEISGALIGIADRVMDTIYTKYFKGIIRYEGIQRIDCYPIPRNVLREAVLNAVVHKDYSTGNPIHIKIYSDKVIIYNDCRFPFDVIPKNFLEGIGSKPHNPLIAGAFFRCGQIEAWGRGIDKMKNGCLADNLPEPQINVLPARFSIAFTIHETTEESVENDTVSEDSDTINATSNTINNTISNTISNTINNTIKLSKSQETILCEIRKNPHVTSETLSEIVNITADNVRVNIAKLRAEGIIERVGSRKKGYWKIIREYKQSGRKK